MFTLFIPASKTEAVLKDLPPKEMVSGKGKILLMDDEEAIRLISGRIIKHLGYEVFTAKDGQEAIDCYRNALSQGIKFDAVIMDLTIPGGMEEKRRFRN